MRSSNVFESREIEVYLHRLGNPAVSLYELRPKRTLKATVLLVPHPLIGCKPYILFSVLLSKRGVRVCLPCTQTSCVYQEYVKLAKYLAELLKPEYVVVHNACPKLERLRLVVLHTDEELLLELCQDDISENCIHASECLRTFTKTKEMAGEQVESVVKVKVNLLDLDSVVKAVNKLCEILQHRC